MSYLRGFFLAILSLGAGWTHVRYPVSAAVGADSLHTRYGVRALFHRARFAAKVRR